MEAVIKTSISGISGQFFQLLYKLLSQAMCVTDNSNVHGDFGIWNNFHNASPGKLRSKVTVQEN